MTAYAVYGLLETQAAGYKVPEDRIRRGVTALARLYRKYPRAIPALKAYMVYVLERAAASKLEPGYLDAGPFDRTAALEEVWASRRELLWNGLTSVSVNAGSPLFRRAANLERAFG